jgi:fatty acid desaturase
MRRHLHQHHDAERTFTADEVLRHGSASDCWVTLERGVYDVTTFLDEHPGGAMALSSVGRAGHDVTSHFLRIGHSAPARERLAEMRVGVLGGPPRLSPVGTATDNNRDAAGGDGPALADPSNDGHAILWHAQRRAAILKVHPEVARLAGDNPWTPLLGIAACIVHLTTALLCGSITGPGGPWSAFALAYTIGAVCKMWQFGVCHDVCHGTAGPLLRLPAVKALSYHLLTLPSVGIETFVYYAFQHTGHHAELGKLPHATPPSLEGTSSKAHRGRAVPDGEGGGKDDHGEPPVARASFLTLDQIDGDLPSPSALNLLFLGHRRKVEQQPSVTPAPLPMPHVSMLARALWRASHLGMTQLGAFSLFAGSGVFFAAAVPPLALLCCIRWLAAATFTVRGRSSGLCHPSWGASEGDTLLAQPASLQESPPPPRCRHRRRRSRLQVADHIAEWLPSATPPCCVDGIAAVVDPSHPMSDCVSYWSCAGLSVGVQAWAWMGAAQLIHSYAGLNATIYLVLSELFLHGFLLHPYAGYFLGVHRSDAAMTLGDDRRPRCQPTTSTYSSVAAALSLNLTHHTEHHDFPSVPWNRLPALTRAAPEYYLDLDWSPGFTSTVWRWLCHGEDWTYACLPVAGD